MLSIVVANSSQERSKEDFECSETVWMDIFTQPLFQVSSSSHFNAYCPGIGTHVLLDHLKTDKERRLTSTQDLADTYSQTLKLFPRPYRLDGNLLLKRECQLHQVIIS